jgi:hypothetical protein
MKTDFIPVGNGDLDSFEENLISKITIHAPALGLNPDEVTESINIISGHRTAFAKMNSKRRESKSATEDNYNSLTRAVNEIRRLAKQIKSSKTYTTGIGDDLGIIGSDIAGKDSVILKPSLKAHMNGQEVVIKFRKEGTDGIKLYSKRGSETEFTFLAVDTASPYNDTREKLDPSKPEQREYYAYFFDTDSDIGQQSDVLKVIVP